MAAASKVLTYEEWLKMPEVEGVEEVVDGEVHILPPASWEHAVVVKRLERQLEKRVDEESVYVMTSSLGVVVSHNPLRSRVPDIAMFRTENVVAQDGYVHSPPELAVEVLSPGNTRQEQTRKLRDYELLGVPEVWIVSPEGRTIEIMQLTDGKLVTTSIVNGGELRPKLFPEAAVEVDRIWPD